jgi:hypothetical protein
MYYWHMGTEALTFCVPLALAGRLSNGAELNVGTTLVQELNRVHRICALSHSRNLSQKIS